MQPRTLDQINASLGSIYDPSIGLINQQVQSIAPQLQADESALQAKTSQAYDDIVAGARRRGVAFGGIPLQEQARYNATEYAPALAGLKTAATQKSTSLADAINQINERRATQANGMFTEERNFFEQQRQFNAQMEFQKAQAAAAERAARAAASGGGGMSPSFGGGGGFDLNSIFGDPKSANMIQRKDGGFNYTDAAGRPISAAAYAAARGVAFRTVLAEAAKAGDKGAKAALGFVGNDMGYDPRKITNKAMADLYNSLVWGTGKTATYKPPVAKGLVKPVYNNNGKQILNGANGMFSNPLAIRK